MKSRVSSKFNTRRTFVDLLINSLLLWSSLDRATDCMYWNRFKRIDCQKGTFYIEIQVFMYKPIIWVFVFAWQAQMDHHQGKPRISVVHVYSPGYSDGQRSWGTWDVTTTLQPMLRAQEVAITRQADCPPGCRLWSPTIGWRCFTFSFLIPPMAGSPTCFHTKSNKDHRI